MPRFTGIQFGGTSAGERTACDIADELNCVKRSEGGDETLKSNVVKSSPRASDATGLLPTATSLLVSLTNPLNITLITSQLLSAPALWEATRDLRACRRIFSVFYTAALQLSQQSPPALRSTGNHLISLQKEKWAIAVINGADDRSPRWRHVLVLGAVLLGFEEKQKQSLEPHLRSKLESALVKATNLALQIDDSEDTIGKHAVAFVLNHTFQLLTNSHLNYDLLLPILMEAVFSSKEGLEQGYWLSMIDRDVVEIAGRKFNWSTRSNTYHMIQKIQDRPLIASLGPMSRLIAHSVGSMDDSSLSLVVLDRLANAARTLSIAWRQNKLSEIDVSEEREFLDAEALQTTLPTLWHLLRLSLFATVIILRAVMGRVLDDPELSSDPRAPFLAIQCLHILRDFYFVSSRLGQTSSSQYVFVSMVAIDILTQYPDQAENFIHSIRPVNQGRIPAHPVDRCMDLFFFNIAEHFTLNVSPKFNEEVVLAAAMPYLIAGGNKFLVETFEAAHSLTLSVLAGPQNAEVSARHLPFYLDALFKCFPESLSERQFRLAFKTMVRISSPPSPPAESQPLLPSILLDTIYERAKHAPTTSLQQAKVSPQNVSHGLSLSEQAVLVMALIDSLCFLHPILLEEWLPLTASLVMQIGGAEMRRVCQDRFWEAMSSGEMDVVRAAICVAWWSSRGGREQLLNDNDELRQEHFMSGALPIESRL